MSIYHTPGLNARIWAIVAAALLTGADANAQDASAANEPAVKLPPMIVQESTKGARWLYASTAGAEYLSGCSASTTENFISAEQQMVQLLHVLVPERFLVQSDVPSITVLYNPDLKRESTDAIVGTLAEVSRETERGEKEPTSRPDSERRGKAIPIGRVELLPSLPLYDRDLKGVFVYLDGAFNADGLALTSDSVRARLRQRTPMLPPWLIEAVVALYGQANFIEDPITMAPSVWISRRDSRAFEHNAEWPRTLLPITDLFGLEMPSDDAAQPRRAAIWRSEVTLFARWGIDPRNGMQDRFWHFVDRASEAPVDEQMFAECFGFGFSDLLDRLSDYIPTAVKEPIHLEARKLPKLPPFEVRPATPDQVARLQGEWGRMEIAYVKARNPELARNYADRARQMLRRAYDRGARDPRLSAAIGLCEIDSGNEAAARPFLDQAASGEVVRPRVYFELARLRQAEQPHDAAGQTMLTGLQVAAVVEPLRIAAKQRPALPEVYALMADSWLRCRELPPASDLSTLSRGARLFRWQPELTFRIALLHAKCGNRAEAATLLRDGLHYVYDDASRARFEQLLARVQGKAPVSK